MSVKEKPLFDAARNIKPLPAFLFDNMIVTGFFAFAMVAVFGGAFVLFTVLGRGAAEPLVLFDAFFYGALIAEAFAAAILIGIFISAAFEKDRQERSAKLQFVLGGMLAIVMLFLAHYIFGDGVRTLLSTQPPIAGPQ